MKRWFLVFTIISIITLSFFSPTLIAAQENPVSIIETGETPGFDPPTTRLNVVSTLFYFLPLLFHNRSLHEPSLINEDENRGEVGASVDHHFMTTMVVNEVNAFKQLVDPYDDPANPSPGYTWDLKIFHPGSTPGKLPSEDAPYPVIIFCPGVDGSDPQFQDALDWMGTYYAQKGYIFGVPIFIENDTEVDGENNQELKSIQHINADIYALQVSQTIDYIWSRLSLLNGKLCGLVDTKHVTLIGYSQGGYVAQRTAVQDHRISRLCLLSSIFLYYDVLYAGVLDTKDVCDLLNGFPKSRGVALHVQRFTKPPYIMPCPDWDPECDWIPPVDGYLTHVDLTLDPWEPYLCEGESCRERNGTYYNYLLYEGPKQSEIKNNILLDHQGIRTDDSENDKGKELTLQLIDEFFDQFPLYHSESHKP